MSEFEKILDQERPIERLKTFLRKGTLPHALLFTGNDGVGKQTCALAVAMACNCLNPVSETDPCGRCASCVKIQSNTHPDVIRIKRTGQIIKIKQIRRLGKSLILKPYQGKTRVVIISGAQDMNPESSAALLKMLDQHVLPSLTFLHINIASNTGHCSVKQGAIARRSDKKIATRI